MYLVFVYDDSNPDFCVEVFRTDSEEVAKFKSNLLEAIGITTAIADYHEE